MFEINCEASTPRSKIVWRIPLGMIKSARLSGFAHDLVASLRSTQQRNPFDCVRSTSHRRIAGEPGRITDQSALRGAVGIAYVVHRRAARLSHADSHDDGERGVRRGLRIVP